MQKGGAAKKKDGFYCGKVAIFFIIMFGFGYLPAVELLTALGMKVLGVFCALLFAWSTIGLLWPSIIGLLGLILLEVMDLKTAFALGWGSNTLLLIFFMTIVAAIVEQSGVSHFIAMWFITRKFILGKPWLFIFVFLFTTFILSAVTSTIPAIMICWSILYSICKQIGYKPFDSFPSFMVVGIVASASFGLALFPFKTIGITVFGVLENMTGLTVDYLTYIFFSIPMGLCCILMFLFMAKLFFKIDVQKLSSLTEASFHDVDLALTKHQKAVLFFLFLLIVLLLLPSILPSSFFLVEALNKIQASGTAMLLVAAMCCVKVDGEAILNYKEVASKGIQWDVIFLVSVVMPLSTALTAGETGITPFLLKHLGPLFADKTTGIFLLMVVIIGVMIANCILQSIAGAILLPVFYPFAVKMGIEPLALTSLLVYVCHFGILTPAASPMAALMHGNTDWIKVRDIYKYGLLIVVSGCFVFCILGVPYVQFVFR